MKLYLEIVRDSNNFVKVEVDKEDTEYLKEKAKEIASTLNWREYKVFLHECRCDEGKTCKITELSL